MSNLFIEFKNLVFKKEVPDASLLVPILVWLSGSEKNIEVCQTVNKKFFNGNRKLFIREVSLYNNIRHIISYPKIKKDDDKTKFFYTDICTYFNWSSRELQKNLSVLDLEQLKTIISKSFGYNNKQRKNIGLGALQYGRSKRIRKTSNKGTTKTKLEPVGSQESLTKFEGN